MDHQYFLFSKLFMFFDNFTLRLKKYLSYWFLKVFWCCGHSSLFVQCISLLVIRLLTVSVIFFGRAIFLTLIYHQDFFWRLQKCWIYKIKGKIIWNKYKSRYRFISILSTVYHQKMELSSVFRHSRYNLLVALWMFDIFYSFPHFYRFPIWIANIAAFLFPRLFDAKCFNYIGIAKFLMGWPATQRPNPTLFVQESKFHRERNKLRSQVLECVNWGCLCARQFR